MSFKIESILVNKGEKAKGYLEGPNKQFHIPITVINGVKEGKTVLVTAGIHGCEYPGIQSAIELSNELDPSEIAGRVIILHPVNISGFYAKTPAIVPEDNKNLNRVFPGKEDGSFSENIANMITQKLHKCVDFYIDLHGGDLHESVMPFVYYPSIADDKVKEAAKKATEVLNVSYRVKSTATTGAYNSAAIFGVPSLLLERGGCGLCNKKDVDLYKKDVYAIFDHLGIIKQKSPLYHKIPIDIKEAFYIESSINGLWYPKVQPGDIISNGEKIGEICDCFGEVLESIYSQVDGVVLYMTVSLAIKQGESIIAYGSTYNMSNYD